MNRFSLILEKGTTILWFSSVFSLSLKTSVFEMSRRTECSYFLIGSPSKFFQVFSPNL